MHFGTKVNGLDSEVNRSMVGVTNRPDMVKNPFLGSFSHYTTLNGNSLNLFWCYIFNSAKLKSKYGQKRRRHIDWQLAVKLYLSQGSQFPVLLKIHSRTPKSNFPGPYHSPHQRVAIDKQQLLTLHERDSSIHATVFIIVTCSKEKCFITVRTNHEN